jgi:hypothetical protein
MLVLTHQLAVVTLVSQCIFCVITLEPANRKTGVLARQAPLPLPPHLPTSFVAIPISRNTHCDATIRLRATAKTRTHTHIPVHMMMPRAARAQQIGANSNFELHVARCMKVHLHQQHQQRQQRRARNIIAVSIISSP